MTIRILAVVMVLAWGGSAAGQGARPNVLWITSEDNGPQLGCYGDGYAQTPNLDGLAKRGMIYLNVWSNAPVCAPARTGIVCGVYPTSTGSEHMRSEVPLPATMKLYPQLMREAGYYCTNNVKEDYNVTKAGQVWDESSRNGHWKKRKPGQPFLAVFNHETTHESQIRAPGHQFKHDPARARVPAYHPDVREVREGWAQYYDKITQMDAQAGQKLKELEEAGLAEETIVFYYGDHGSGMPRSKRTPMNSGLRVPLIVHVPEKYKHLAPADYVAGGKSDRLVSFIDLAPTLLSIAGVEAPRWMQGYAFMGKHAVAGPKYLHGFRGRMDERIDLVRSVFDGRYVYVRNYMPHRPHGQHVGYQFQTPATAVWKKLFDEGKLTAEQAYFWQSPRAPEELYDLESDPDEVKNLAKSMEHQEILQRMRQAQLQQAIDVRDVGFLPEGEIHSRSRGSTPYEMGHDDGKYPIIEVIDAASLASNLEPGALPKLKEKLEHSDSAVRYWGAMGLLMRGKEAVGQSKVELEAALADSSPFVRIQAAEALARFGSDEESKKGLAALVDLSNQETHDHFVAAAALNAVDNVGARNEAIKEQLKLVPARVNKGPARSREYVSRMLETILRD